MTKLETAKETLLDAVINSSGTLDGIQYVTQAYLTLCQSEEVEASVAYISAVPNNDASLAYNALLNEVQSKFPEENRHETALRYIREAEVLSGVTESKEKA